jgi:hypothetical protein
MSKYVRIPDAEAPGEFKTVALADLSDQEVYKHVKRLLATIRDLDDAMAEAIRDSDATSEQKSDLGCVSLGIAKGVAELARTCLEAGQRHSRQGLAEPEEGLP